MRKWRWLSHTLGKAYECIEIKHCFAVRRELKGEEDQNNLGKGQFSRRQENEAEHGARLRDWRVKESHRDALQTPYFLNGAKGFSTTNNLRKQMQTLSSRPQT
jgi:hypothetical protein